MSNVKVRVLVNLTDQRAGDEAWVPDGPRVRGMVAGGYWAIVDREIVTKKKAVRDATDPDQPE